MANAAAHAIGAAVAVGGFHAAWEKQSTGVSSALPIGSALLAANMGSLPDLVEPAIHPNHRQFFHSLAFALAMGWGLKQVWDWEPESPVGSVGRFVLLCAGGAYLTHLAMDAVTGKSIPLVGKI